MTYNNWLGNGQPISAAQRAVYAWRRIQRNPQSVIILRDGVALAAQTVRLEPNNSIMTPAAFDTGEVVRQRVTIFGVYGHPMQANTDIEEGDWIVLDNRGYVVRMVIRAQGEVQAIAEAQE